jgi:hypothetical protein
MLPTLLSVAAARLPGLSALAAIPLGGMRPHPMLTDVARARLQTISFFIVVLLACALLVKLLWNWLRKDFPALPRLTYRKAVGVTGLWGLLFIIVLAMISGARELMTPGAWEKKPEGGYRLRDPKADAAQFARHKQMEALRTALWSYATGHDGKFPPHDLVPEVPAETWLPPHPSGLRYVYVPGAAADREDVPVAYEPGVFGGDRLVLFSSGRIAQMPARDFQQTLEERRRARGAAAYEAARATAATQPRRAGP